MTLLFADVEGSTRLLHLLGERFAPARARMRELVRKAARDNRGAEVDWAGDGVFLAFARAGDAVAAAAEIQRSLAAEPWPHDEAHRLRIGIHTGEPELGPEGYVGMDVVVAARVCAAAHGEQIVVTRATRDMAGDEPLPGATFRQLGHHRLKDVPAPAQVYQLVAPGLREEFPPLTTLTATSLPALHHRLVGRADALARVEGLLEGGVRLVTVIGPGGAGKSRLALEVAARAAVERPVHLVGLAPVTDVALVPSAIARAIGARESGSRTVLESVADQLEGLGALLFIDNLEHLPTAASHVAELIDLVPDLQLLATSRMPLRLSTEHVLPLEPLSIEDATTLFVELAAARGVLLHEDALGSVHEICRRLDGLPLAIELVAARLAVLPPAEILRALGEGLALEMEGPVDLPERQRTLRAAIDWSYERLSPSQRALHGALAVFADSGSLADARAIAGAGPEFLRDLEALVGWSLVRGESTDGELRLSMLRTVREYALEHERGEGRLDELQQRHAERFLALALEAEAGLAGTEQAAWLERLEGEHDNLATALDWLLASGRVSDALRATAALERFWRAHGHASEARRWLALGLGLGHQLPHDVRARALWTGAHEAMMQSDYAAAVPALEEALQLFRELGDDRYSVFALCELARALSSQDELDAAEAAAQEALSIAGAAEDDRAASAALDTLAMIASYRGELTGAQELSARSLTLRRSLGDPLLIAASANTLGLAAMRSGDVDTAQRAFEECLMLAGQLGEKVLKAAVLCALGEIELGRKRTQVAADHLLESLELYGELGDERGRAECIHALGGVAAAEGQPRLAAQLWGAAEQLRERHGAALTPDEKAVDDAFSAMVVAELGDDELTRLRSEGRRLDIGELVMLGADLGSVVRTE